MFVHKLTGKTSDHKDKLKDSQEEGGDKQRAQTAWQQNAAITLQQITLTFVGGLVPSVLDTNRIIATSLVYPFILKALLHFVTLLSFMLLFCKTAIKANCSKASFE